MVYVCRRIDVVYDFSVHSLLLFIECCRRIASAMVVFSIIEPFIDDCSHILALNIKHVGLAELDSTSPRIIILIVVCVICRKQVGSLNAGIAFVGYMGKSNIALQLPFALIEAYVIVNASLTYLLVSLGHIFWCPCRGLSRFTLVVHVVDTTE